MKNIADKIFYVGINDRVTHLFERLWSLRRGVSYNSYVVVDEKIAVVDTVEASFASAFMQNIERATAGRPVDYLIVNHMEPDHSGAIVALRQRYPQMKIVGNAKTLQMINGYYGISDNVVEVADGSTLSLGGETLTFYLAPMVHWPETMVTYGNNAKILFSGDAFGCFGALDGGVTDEELSFEDYYDEMVRYYACIVGKYGSPVQKALQKLSSLPIDIIAATHGPVWKRSIEKVVRVYDELSRYSAQRGVVVAYGSMYGNTAALCEEIACRLREKGVEKIKIYDLSSADISEVLRDIFLYRGLVVASPTYNNELFPPVRELLEKISERTVKGRLFGFVGSYTWASAALKRFGEKAEKCGWETLPCCVEMKQSSLSVTDELIDTFVTAFSGAL
ncbi:MAG: FprA family A-type flavoprotein [Bacteroidales bacterium]|nr:FprA family A-type flavoprotein [Bacteroidales bacterium]